MKFSFLKKQTSPFEESGIEQKEIRRGRVRFRIKWPSHSQETLDTARPASGNVPPQESPEPKPSQATFRISSDFKQPEPPPLSEGVALLGREMLAAGEHVANTTVHTAAEVGGEIGRLGTEALSSFEMAGTDVVDFLTPEKEGQEGAKPKEANTHHVSPHERLTLESLPIGWNALRELRKFSLFGNRDIADIRPSESLYVFIPMVASVVANKYDPKQEMRFPTYEEVLSGASTQWALLKISEKVLNLLSKKWLAQFKANVEEAARLQIVGVGSRIAEIGFLMREVKNPRQQCLKEIEMLYKNIAKPIRLGGEEVKIENKIGALLSAFWRIKQNPKVFDNVQHPYGLSSRDFPILVRLLPLLNLPPESILDEMDAKYKVSAVGSEIMQGTETFLRTKGVQNVPVAPRKTEATIADPDTWVRGMGEAFAGDTIARVRTELPRILSLLVDVLPENGKEFSQSIFDLSLSILNKNQKGASFLDIGRDLFKGRHTEMVI